MGRKVKRKRERRRARRRATRALQRVRELFSNIPPESPADSADDGLGGLGLREPRRPLHPTLSGAVALEAPPDEGRDLWAVGEERD